MSNQTTLIKTALLVTAILLQSCGGSQEYAGIDRGGGRLDL